MFKLTMDTDNAAFEDGYKTEEIARILRRIAENVENGETDNSGVAMDINGNIVGGWSID